VAVKSSLPNSTTKAIERTIRYLTLFALTLAIAPALALAVVAANSGASAMSQSGAKVASPKSHVEDKKVRCEDGKASAKKRRHDPAEKGRAVFLPFFHFPRAWSGTESLNE